MGEEETELDHFSNLSSQVKSIRMNSVRGILHRMRSNLKSGHRVVHLMCKRLFRGLGGSNPHLRQGCFSTIVGFLKSLPDDFDLGLIEHLIESELSPVGSDSKLEEGEAYLGQLLAYGALIASDFLFIKSVDEQDIVFDKIFQLSQRRSYLHHVAFTLLVMMLNKSKREYSPDGFLAHLRDLSSYTFDKLYYILTLVNLSIKTGTIKQIFGTKIFFDINNAVKLASLLKKNKSLKMFEHKFFNLFLCSVLDHPQFSSNFWDAICDIKGHGEENDVSIKSYSDLFILRFGNEIFKGCTSLQRGNLAASIFNDKLINIILRICRRERKLVQNVLQEFCQATKFANDEVKLKLVIEILFEKGLLNFDNLTGSKTLFTITNSLSFDSLNNLADEYKSIIEFRRQIPKKGIESKSKTATICVNYLTKIINNPICCNKINWRLSQITYLLKLGFFKQTDLQFNRELTQSIQEAFLTSLGHRFPNLESLQQVIEGIVFHMDSLIQDSNVSLINDFTEEMSGAWKCSMEVANKMEKFAHKNPAQKETVFVLKLLLQYMSILLLKEPSTAVMNILDLKNIFKELTEDDNKEMWIGVLIDLFLNLLSKPNYYHRHIIRCTFKFVCPHLTLDAFLQIINVLDLSYENTAPEYVEDEEESASENESPIESSDDEEMEDLSKNEKLRLELRSALGGGSDNESIDIDEMDEDEGKKLDETLSSIFRANMKRKRNNHLTKYENQLAHFRTRVMDLIEICTEVTLPLAYWVKALMPIIGLFGSTVGQSKLDCLRSRISCCLKKLNASKTIFQTVSTEEILEVVENLLQKLSKPSGVFADMKNELILVLKFLLKASKPLMKGLKPKNIKTNEIYQAINRSVKSFFEGKSSTPVQLYTGLAAIGWDGVFPLIPEVLEYSRQSSKPHKKMAGLGIVEAFCKTPQYFDGHLEKYYPLYLPLISELLSETIANEFESMCNSSEVSNKYNSELWALANVIITRQNKSQIPVMIDVEKISNKLELQERRVPPMKGKCKQNFRKLCSTISSQGTLVSSVNKENEGHSSTANKTKLLKRKRKGDIIVKKKKKIKTTKLISI